LLVVSSFAAWAAAWYLAYRSLSLPYAFTLACTVVIAGIQVRIFTIQHDCGHGSFSRRRWLADLIGVICSLVTIVPYHEWKRHHTLHHATAGMLERRGHGDVWTMTVAEFAAAPPRTRLRYRLFRHPLVMFLVGPPLLFLLARRWPTETPRAWRVERMGVYATNLALALVYLLAGRLVGFAAFVRVYLPTTIIMSWMGAWLFYIEHQFEHTYWVRADAWSWEKEALRGSSYYLLGPVLQWFANSVNLHHVHHASPLVPSYNLQRCHDENEEFRGVPPVTLLGAITSARLALWSESKQRLVSFGVAEDEIAACARAPG
jgi:omega-6 fatty acid desaturase (delta-12 desaturase)